MRRITQKTLAVGLRLTPDGLIEAVARIVGYAARVSLDRGYPAERIVRGTLIGARSGAWRLKLCRNVQLERPRRIRLGYGVTIHANCQLLAGRGHIAIGDDTHLAGGTVLAGLGGIDIGRGCAISSGVAIYSVTNQFSQKPTASILDNDVMYAPVAIGEDVWIGAGATVLPGVTIGAHAVIGAGSVVNRDIPAWQVVAGTPAKPLRDRRAVPDQSPKRLAG